MNKNSLGMAFVVARRNGPHGTARNSRATPQRTRENVLWFACVRVRFNWIKNQHTCLRRAIDIRSSSARRITWFPVSMSCSLQFIIIIINFDSHCDGCLFAPVSVLEREREQTPKILLIDFNSTRNFNLIFVAFLLRHFQLLSIESCAAHRFLEIEWHLRSHHRCAAPSVNYTQFLIRLMLSLRPIQ